jgi:two-component sensor histidine kinase
MRSSLEPRFDDAVLVISELVTNSVRHGHSDEDIEVVVRATDTNINLQVSDGGQGFEENGHHGDGIGLQIVEKIAREWGTRKKQGFTVWVELTKAGAAAS